MAVIKYWDASQSAYVELPISGGSDVVISAIAPSNHPKLWIDTTDGQVIETLDGTNLLSKTVSLSALADDTKYSMIVSSLSRTIQSYDLGRTLMVAGGGMDITLTLDKSVTDAWPIGFETAIIWRAANSITINATGGIYLANSAAGQMFYNGIARLNGIFSMVAIKKIEATVFLITGGCEVTAN